MKRLAARWLIALLATTTLLPADAQALHPAPYRAEYEVLRNGKLVGRGVVTLEQGAADTLHYLSQTRGTEGLAVIAGLEIVESSTLRWHDGQLESLGYRYRQEAAWRSRERSVSFDPAAGTIVSRDRRGEHRFAFAHGVLDRQGVALALAADLSRGERGDLVYSVVDRDEFGPQTYRVGVEETVDTPAGRLRALRVERIRDDSRGRSTTSWMGVEQGFLPVRVLQRESDGDSFETRLISLRR